MRNPVTSCGQWIYLRTDRANARMAALARSGNLASARDYITTLPLDTVDDAVTYAAARGGPFQRHRQHCCPAPECCPAPASRAYTSSAAAAASWLVGRSPCITSASRRTRRYERRADTAATRITTPARPSPTRVTVVLTLAAVLPSA